MALRTTIPESDARLVQWRNNPHTASITLVRKWTDVDATTADNLVAALPTTVTNPQADKQTYTGVFSGNANIARGEDDRSVTITQVLTGPTGDPFVISYIENCTTSVALKHYFDRSLAQYKSLVETALASSTNGVTVRPRTDQGEGDTYTVILEYRSALYQEVDTYTTEVDSLGTTTEKVQSNVTTQTIVAAAPTAGAAVTQTIRKNADCSKEAITKTEVATKLYMVKTYRDQYGSSTIARGYNHTEDEMNAQIVALGLATYVSGASGPIHAVTASTTQNGFTFDTARAVGLYNFTATLTATAGGGTSNADFDAGYDAVIDFKSDDLTKSYRVGAKYSSSWTTVNAFTSCSSDSQLLGLVGFFDTGGPWHKIAGKGKYASSIPEYIGHGRWFGCIVAISS